MFELNQEKTLMYSDDGSITLTTHRLAQQTENGKKQLMLEDYVSYGINKTIIGNYKILLIVFSVITSLLLIMDVNRYFEERNLINTVFSIDLLSYLQNDILLILSLFLLLLSLFFFLIAKRKTVKVVGKYNVIEFRVNKLNKKSLNRFLATMIREAEQRKKEKQ